MEVVNNFHQIELVRGLSDAELDFTISEAMDKDMKRKHINKEFNMLVLGDSPIFITCVILVM